MTAHQVPSNQCQDSSTILDFLTQFFESESPPRVLIRVAFVYMVVYGFGDASGTGFGSTFTVLNGVSYRIGVWKPEESDESSNWREFTNVVESLEKEAESGCLDSAHRSTSSLTTRRSKQLYTKALPKAQSFSRSLSESSSWKPRGVFASSSAMSRACE
jgi:hypothetical protein